MLQPLARVGGHRHIRVLREALEPSTARFILVHDGRRRAEPPHRMPGPLATRPWIDAAAQPASSGICSATGPAGQGPRRGAAG